MEIKPRIIAFYLPQYHPIPENDKWWGKGFTEWFNVVKGKPRFRNHYQPHLPADLGFYDLRLEEIRIAQAEMAKEHGLGGFCYYHYWFNGKMLLERPFNEVLSSGKPDFPFCLCWANENWTRKWDGLEDEIIMKQNYDEYNSEQHILWIEKAFADKRYIRINNKPLFLIYRADSIPKLEERIILWRKIIKEKGYDGIYLCSVKSFHNKLSEDEIIKMGFDALVEFYPGNDSLPHMKYLSLPRFLLFAIINKLISILGLKGRIKKLPITFVYDYELMVNKIINKTKSKYQVFPCVIPSWDNTARSRWATVIQNKNIDIYKKWLNYTFERIKNNSIEEQIVFINAWNEWAEGCHLEPDVRNGKKYLKATAEVINKQINESMTK
ncbi:MAG: glycoside hydrolase family 99-like domain-containing protein [Ignavibacteriae bacterium]|nr:glycoside hydrolase family 99-like domain-containing protein [Ignavibacteriota bacterium]